MKYKIELTIKLYDDNYNPIDEVDINYVKARLNANKLASASGHYGNVELYCPVDRELYGVLSEYIPEAK